MTRTALAKTSLLALAALGLAPAAATAQSGSGGAAPSQGGSGPSSPSSPAPTTAAQAIPAPTLVTAGGGVSLRLQASAILGHGLGISGAAPRRDGGVQVLIQRLDRRRGWLTVATATTNSRGGFQVNWRTSLVGRIPLRALVASASAASRRAVRPASSQPAQVTVYRPAVATWFGPGFYGQKTACGQTMSPSLVGVANRTLPCGTLVEVSYGGERLTVPVVDRGPYANGADWDLTAGAAQALSITETVHIGTIVVGRAPNTPDLGQSSSPAAASGSGGAAAL